MPKVVKIVSVELPADVYDYLLKAKDLLKEKSVNSLLRKMICQYLEDMDVMPKGES